MPSPIAHCSVALIAWPALRGEAAALPWWRRGLLLAAVLFTLIAPDIDIALGLWLGSGPFADHGGPTHSLLAAALWGVVFALVCKVVIGGAVGGRAKLLRFWTIGFAAYASHVVFDVLTHGRGVMMLWPWEQRLASPVPLFVGVRHSHPDAWGLHAITIVTELLTVALIWWFARRLFTDNRQHRSIAAARHDEGGIGATSVKEH
jgi:membrane-bound metal-dependent hydrolase YbcI (DUF457 family)